MELAGSVATVGRDPSSDLVLNDPKCSRRHAVIESAPDGVVIRDSGSANGIYVNGRKTERARIRDGDLVKLGDVVLTVLPEPVAGTVVMEEVELRPAGRHEAPPPGADTPVEAREALAPGRPRRPLTVALLAVLWGLSVPVYAIGGFVLSWPAHSPARFLLVAGGLALAVFSGVMAAGVWLARRWAYVAQLVAAGLGLFLCPFSLASIAVLVYMLRPAARWHFSDRREPEPEGAGQAEAMFAGSVLGAVVLGVLLTAALTFLARTARTVASGRPGGLLVRTPASETAALEQLRTLAAAEDAFHSVCNTGYGDLQALRRPGTVIPQYPPGGPAFLRGSTFDEAERGGYRYTLAVEDEMPPAPGCPTRRFRRYQYSATPLSGDARALALGPDGVVHAAEGRPATLDDPALPE